MNCLIFLVLHAGFSFFFCRIVIKGLSANSGCAAAAAARREGKRREREWMGQKGTPTTTEKKPPRTRNFVQIYGYSTNRGGREEEEEEEEPICR